MDFNSPLAFASFIQKVALAVPLAKHASLEEAASLVLKTVKDEPGEYQSGMGPFPDWQELAPSTLDDKARKGLPSPSPLKRSGALADSYEKTVGLESAHVGSNDDKAVWQELGTRKIPPRSVIGLAAVKCEKEIHELTGRTFVGLLTSGRVNQKV